MLRTMLISKIHRATVTNTDLNYTGSITLDKGLIEKANILENERVEVLDINNGNRFITYAICNEKNDGSVIINGAAARLVHKGDKIIILNYGLMQEEEAKRYKPKIVIMDDNNRITKII
ncbi:MAG: aspartate 1-decarboxylase [Candidatus Cloacimonadota bacterium]|nr:MAG: aspartate 1-decarboxylase [Candidatus Cloacimonadota bacterium]